MAELFQRKYRIESTRLRGFDYSMPGSYFVTINVFGRKRLLGKIQDKEMVLSPLGQIVAEEWIKTETLRPKVRMDVWQVMPDHFHGIVMIHESESSARLGVIPFVNWDRSMVVAGQQPVETDGRPSPQKNKFGPQSNNLASIIRGFKSACTNRIHTAGHLRFRWQPLFWDRIIRDQDELDRIRTYIKNNPIRWQEEHLQKKQSFFPRY